jgi:hypothetical protein
VYLHDLFKCAYSEPVSAADVYALGLLLRAIFNPTQRANYLKLHADGYAMSAKRPTASLMHQSWQTISTSFWLTGTARNVLGI